MKMTLFSKLDEVTAPEQEILARRAERLRGEETRQEESSERVLWVAEFTVGTDRYALSLDVMRACIPLRNVAAVPLAPSDVVGVMRFEGQSVTVFSLAALLAERGWAKDPSVLLIVEPAPGHLMGIDCEEIPVPLALSYSKVSVARARSKDPILPIDLEGTRRLQLIDLPALLQRRAGVRRGA